MKLFQVLTKTTDSALILDLTKIEALLINGKTGTAEVRVSGKSYEVSAESILRALEVADITIRSFAPPKEEGAEEVTEA